MSNKAIRQGSIIIAATLAIAYCLLIVCLYFNNGHMRENPPLRVSPSVSDTCASDFDAVSLQEWLYQEWLLHGG